MTRILRSESSLCFGREDLCDNIVHSAFESGAVLLFGGRQSGKTTVLRKITRDLSAVSCNVDDLCRLDLPVYVDLMRLPYDAAPRDFFRMLSQLALEACQRQITGFALQSLPLDAARERGLLDFFIADIQTILEAAGNVNIYFIFLLDESKRVLFDRFPRGFQDNLFALLFGGTSISERCSIVFAGAQELYRFCEDETSPIGSRAEKHFIVNLPFESVREIVRQFKAVPDDKEVQHQAEMVFTETGGHAGLSTYLVSKLALSSQADNETLQSIVKVFQTQHSELFQMWMHRLSPEAQIIQSRLLTRTELSFKEIARLLNENKMHSYRADRVCEELQFTGIALLRSDSLFVVNNMYAEVARAYIVEQTGTEDERPVWSLLKEVEVNIRSLIRKRYDERWPGNADAQIEKCLGADSWRQIQKNQDKYEASYPRSIKDKELDILDFTYLGQLGQLILWQSAWEMFKHMFRDKRDLEDMLLDINPVRNDFAHFRSVPYKELIRCRTRCEDLLVIVEKELLVR